MSGIIPFWKEKKLLCNLCIKCSQNVYSKSHFHPQYFVVLGWAIAIAVALACLYGIHGDITDENVSSVGVSAFYNVVARSAWGACISWVIVTCVAGYGGQYTQQKNIMSKESSREN